MVILTLMFSAAHEVLGFSIIAASVSYTHLDVYKRQELNLLKSIERLAPEVFAREKGSTKELCANVDMYSGFIYSMMGIPEDLFTPLFACARMAGWAAHRFEEIAAGKRIIRPAYKNTIRGTKPYIPIERR